MWLEWQACRCRLRRQRLTAWIGSGNIFEGADFGRDGRSEETGLSFGGLGHCTQTGFNGGKHATFAGCKEAIGFVHHDIPDTTEAHDSVFTRGLNVVSEATGRGDYEMWTLREIEGLRPHVCTACDQNALDSLARSDSRELLKKLKGEFAGGSQDDAKDTHWISRPVLQNGHGKGHCLS